MGECADILSAEYELCGEKIVNRRKWKCSFCGCTIRAYEGYFWVRRKGNMTATLKACTTCADKRFQEDLKEICES